LSSEIHVLQNRDQSRLLRLDALDDTAKQLLSAGGFDGVEVTRDFGGLEQLAPWQQQVRWLFAPQAASSEGLQTLTSLERITFVGSQSGYPFDYRLLPKLRVIECGSAGEIKVKLLNHPRLERLELAGGDVKDFAALAQATALQAVLLDGCKTKTLKGVGVMRELRELRLLESRSLSDISALAELPALEILVITAAARLAEVSAITQLGALRCLHVEAKTASLADLDFIAAMPQLEVLQLWVPVQRVDWARVAAHPGLCEIGLQLPPGQQFDDDASITAAFAAARRTVRKLTRFSGASPQIKLELDPAPGRQPGPPLGNNLRRLLSPMAHARS
jgi:hypothetical protein